MLKILRDTAIIVACIALLGTLLSTLGLTILNNWLANRKAKKEGGDATQ